MLFYVLCVRSVKQKCEKAKEIDGFSVREKNQEWKKGDKIMVHFKKKDCCYKVALKQVLFCIAQFIKAR